PGLADFGTRLKANFSNIPSGARLFVSFTNVTTTNVSVANVGTVPSVFYTVGATPANNATSVGSNTAGVFAELLQPGAEATPDTNVPPVVASPLFGTATVIGTVGYPYVEIPVSGGSATAVWEILNANSSALDTATFSVF